MDPYVKISRSVLSDLSRVVGEGNPILSTVRGDLFVSDRLLVAAIRLNIPVADYLGYLVGLTESEQPKMFKVVIVDDRPFQVVITGAVEVNESGTLIDGKPATIL